MTLTEVLLIILVNVVLAVVGYVTGFYLREWWKAGKVKDFGKLVVYQVVGLIVVGGLFLLLAYGVRMAERVF